MMVRGGGGLTGLYATTVLNQRGLSESVLPQVGAMQLAQWYLGSGSCTYLEAKMNADTVVALSSS
jgi:hypothetical protein